MLPINWKKFLHPAGVYRLEYPAHWDRVRKDEARSCGFGPHDRDDVGLCDFPSDAGHVDRNREAGQGTAQDHQPGTSAYGGGLRPPHTDPAPLQRQGQCAQEGKEGHYSIVAGRCRCSSPAASPGGRPARLDPTLSSLLPPWRLRRRRTGPTTTDQRGARRCLRQQHAEQDFQLDKDPRAEQRRVSNNLHRKVAAPARRSESSGVSCKPGSIHGSAAGARILTKDANLACSPFEASQLPHSDSATRIRSRVNSSPIW